MLLVEMSETVVRSREYLSTEREVASKGTFEVNSINVSSEIFV